MLNLAGRSMEGARGKREVRARAVRSTQPLLAPSHPT
jgi:hypothetical protein